MNKKTGTLMLIITNDCNLNCVYCYERHKKNTVMSLEIAQSYISKYLSSSQYSFISINIFGGEAFLYFKRIREICEWTWDKKWKTPFRFHLSTNGTLLDTESKEWLKKNKNRVNVSLSLDGTRNSHNKNRSNSYDSIDLDFFKKTWKNQAIKMTVSELSLPNLANDVTHIHNLGFEIFECNLAFGIDWSSDKNIIMLKRELKKLCKFYINNPRIKPAQIIDMEIGCCENEKEIKKACTSGKELMTVDVDGRIYPCHFITPMTFFQKEIDLLLNTNFIDIKKLIDYDCFNDCYIYSICPTCYGANYLLTKSINSKDKTICDLMKVRALYSAALKSHKIMNIELNELNIEEKSRLYKTIKAIKKISKLYSKI